MARVLSPSYPRHVTQREIGILSPEISADDNAVDVADIRNFSGNASQKRALYLAESASTQNDQVDVVSFHALGNCSGGVTMLDGFLNFFNARFLGSLLGIAKDLVSDKLEHVDSTLTDLFNLRHLQKLRRNLHIPNDIQKMK